jgi:hypothetical protein
MEIELHIEELETERRWNRLQWFQQEFRPPHGTILGSFLSFRSDQTFVWLHGFRDREERLASHEHPPSDAFVVQSTVRTLTPAIGSTITELHDFARIAESPLLELRQYRLAPGTRARFATFLRDRTLDAQVRCGMVVYGPFDCLEDDDLLVWFRGFPNLLERDRRKADFYQGAYWLNELQDEAFTMIADYSNVILVTPV